MSAKQQLPAIPESSQASLKHIRGGMRRHLLVGGVAFFAIVFGLGGMAATFDFAGAVATQGRLVVNSSVKKVQHVTGGTVTELNGQGRRSRQGGRPPHPPRSDRLPRPTSPSIPRVSTRLRCARHACRPSVTGSTS